MLGVGIMFCINEMSWRNNGARQHGRQAGIALARK